VWLELPRPLKSRALFEEALSHGVCFAPGDAFSASDRYAHCLRLSCGHGWHPRIEKGVTRLGELATAALARR
jgi:DNA-binding transcriptional MocR family regulator